MVANLLIIFQIRISLFDLAVDRVYGKKGVGKGLGVVGLITKGLIDRTEYYRKLIPSKISLNDDILEGHALILALAPFANQDVYNPKQVFL